MSLSTATGKDIGSAERREHGREDPHAGCQDRAAGSDGIGGAAKEAAAKWIECYDGSRVEGKERSHTCVA